jgi:hypothetical protein
MVFGFFKKNKKEEPDINDLVLPKLLPGFLVDFDMRTFQVAARNRYHWEDGGDSDEWELQEGDETWFLERSEDDGYVEWTFSQKLSISELEGDIPEYIAKQEDPPEKVTFQGKTYHLEEDDIGEYFRGDAKEGLKFIVWDYESEDGEELLSIEQWGEIKFDLTIGYTVEEYQFTNILPSGH